MTSSSSKIEYDNWLTVGRAIQITQAAVAPLIQSHIDCWHQSLLLRPHLKSCGSCICTTMSSKNCSPCICTENTLKPCDSCVCSSAPTKCSFCVAWKGELESLRLPEAEGTIYGNSWGNSIWKDFDKVPWEVAKLFMSPLGLQKSDVKDAASTDLGALMNLLERLSLTVPFASRSAVVDVRNVRNRWAHAVNQTLSNADMYNAKHSLRGILADPKFACDADIQAADKQLEQLFEDNLTWLLDAKLNVMKELNVWLDQELQKLREDKEDIKNLEEMKNCITSALEVTTKEKEHIAMEGKQEIKSISQLSEAEDLKELLEKTKKVSNKTKDTVKSFRTAADYLEEVWKDCEIARYSGRSAELFGGFLTMGGVLITTVTMGLALPVMLVGVGIAAAGVGTNTVVSIAQGAIDSPQIKKAQQDVQETMDCLNEVNNLIQMWLDREDKARLLFTWILAMQTLEFSDPARKILQEAVLSNLPNSGPPAGVVEAGIVSGENVVDAQAARLAGARTALQVVRGVEIPRKGGLVKEVLNPLYWFGGGINLGFTISDIVKNKGSETVKWLRQKADELEKGKPKQ